MIIWKKKQKKKNSETVNTWYLKIGNKKPCEESSGFLSYPLKMFERVKYAVIVLLH